MVNLKEKVTNKLESTRLWVLRTLRDFPELRPVEKRRELIKKVNELSGLDLYSDTITRMARNIQNTNKLYLPEDKRNELEQIHHEFFK